MLLFQVADKNSWRMASALKQAQLITLQSFYFQTKVLESKSVLSAGKIIHNITKLNLGYNKITASGVLRHCSLPA